MNSRNRTNPMLLLSLLLPAAAQAATVRGELGRRVDEYLTRLERFGFSGAVLLAQKGEIQLSKGYGFADRARKILFTEETVSTIGSITKQFTAAAILKLEMQGKLRVDDPMSKYLPDVPEDKAGITLHHLLTHAAGFRGDFRGSDPEPIGRDELTRRVLAEPLEARPGERYEYSNEGYSLLGAIIERVSGQPYEQYLRENLFLPAGMQDTGYVKPRWKEGTVAQGYRDGQLWGTVTEKGWGAEGPGWYLKANGGIHSTPGDMYKWHLALQGETVLSAAAKARMFTPHIPEGPGADSHYGYGWAIFSTERNTRLIAHNGANGIFAADLRRYVDEDVVLYAHSNAEVSAIQVTDILPAILFGGEFAMPPKTIDMAPAALNRYAGSYRAESGEVVTLAAVEGRLRIDSDAGRLFALLNGFAPAGSEQFRAVEGRTRELVEAGARGDYEVIQKAFGPRMSLEQVRNNERDMWAQRRQRYGEFKGVEVLGSGRGVGMGIGVYTRILFERGSHLIRYAWGGGSLMGLRMVPPQGSAEFVPASDTEFASFTLRPARTLHLRFRLDGDRATELVLAAPGVELKARRAQ